MDAPSCKERLSIEGKVCDVATRRVGKPVPKTGVVCKSRATRIWWFFRDESRWFEGALANFWMARSPVDDGEW
jgi:hypothetical protein